jgi:hypothetical protein
LEKAFRNLAQSLFRSSHQFLTGETFIAEAETSLTARLEYLIWQMDFRKRTLAIV